MIEHKIRKYSTVIKSLVLKGICCHQLEKAMAPHSSTLAWKIPWTEEPGWLQSTGSQRVGHKDFTSLHFTSGNIVFGI